ATPLSSSSRRRYTRSKRNWSSDVCSSDLEFWEGQAGFARRSAEHPPPPYTALPNEAQTPLAPPKILSVRSGFAMKTPPRALGLRSDERRVGTDDATGAARDGEITDA